jgi:proline iminopeptidase
MTTLRHALLLAALLGLAAGGRVFAAEQRWTPAQAEIADRVKAWEVASLAGNVDAIMRLTAPGFMGWDLAKPAPVDRAAYRGEGAAFFAQFDVLECALPVTAIQIDGETAAAHGRYYETVKDPNGAQMKLQGSWTASLRRSGKKWLFLSLTTSEDRQPTDETAIKVEVAKAMDDFKAAVEKVDLAAVLAIAADVPEFRYVMPDGSVIDFAGWKQGHIDYFATVAAHRFFPKSQDIAVLASDTALVTWKGAMEVVPKDGAVLRVDPFAATFLFKRIDGAWKLVHQNESGPPPQPVATSTQSASSAVPPETPAAFVHPAGEFVTVNGARLWVESVGTGEPILLISGGPGTSHNVFHPWFSDLAHTHRVIYFDALGRGKSDRATNSAEYTFDRDVSDVVELSKALGLTHAVIIGHSYGGMVAQAIALRHPGLVHKLVLVTSLYNASVWNAGNDNVNREIEMQYPELWAELQALRTEGKRCADPAFQEVYLKIPMGLSFYRDASAEAKVGMEFNSDVYYAIAGTDADFAVGGSLAGFDFSTGLKSLTMPVLVLCGRFDRVVPPKLALRFLDYAPQAQLVMFEKSGHFPFVEETELTLATLRAFLAR